MFVVTVCSDMMSVVTVCSHNVCGDCADKMSVVTVCGGTVSVVTFVLTWSLWWLSVVTQCMWWQDVCGDCADKMSVVTVCADTMSVVTVLTRCLWRLCWHNVCDDCADCWAVGWRCWMEHLPPSLCLTQQGPHPRCRKTWWVRTWRRWCLLQVDCTMKMQVSKTENCVVSQVHRGTAAWYRGTAL